MSESKPRRPWQNTTGFLGALSVEAGRGMSVTIYMHRTSSDGGKNYIHFFLIFAFSSSTVCAWSLSSNKSSTLLLCSIQYHHRLGMLGMLGIIPLPTLPDERSVSERTGKPLIPPIPRSLKLLNSSTDVRDGGDWFTTITDSVPSTSFCSSPSGCATVGSGRVSEAVGSVDRARFSRKGGERRIEEEERIEKP